MSISYGTINLFYQLITLTLNDDRVSIPIGPITNTHHALGPPCRLLPQNTGQAHSHSQIAHK